MTRTDGANGCSAIYVTEGIPVVKPFDGRHDIVDIWDPDFAGLITVCRCPPGQKQRRRDQQAIRDAVQKAVDRDQTYM